MRNYFVTFDIEEWCHANFNSLKEIPETTENDLDKEVDIMLDMCEERNIKSTCFILGVVAEKYPQVVKKIYNAGHEVASHGYDHKLVYNMTPEEFNNDISKSCKLLEDIIGEKIQGYRAPSWSVKKDNLSYYYYILDNNGITYSSSIYPAYTYLYGVPDAPANPFIVQLNSGKEVVEIPVPTTNVFGKKFGYTGGFYLRFFPYWFIKSKIISNKNDFFLYLHPRELMDAVTKLPLNMLESFIAYYGIKNCRNKLGKLMNYLANTDYKIILMKDYADNIGILPKYTVDELI